MSGGCRGWEKPVLTPPPFTNHGGLAVNGSAAGEPAPGLPAARVSASEQGLEASFHQQANAF